MTSKLIQECFEQSFNMSWDSVDEFTQAVWETAWEASRATLVVKLPDPMMYDTEKHGAAAQYKYDTKKSLESLGVKVED